MPAPYQTNWTVDPNQLVSTNLNSLLSSGNPYIANARAQGEQGAASRGFLNGSMAAGASENAAIAGALPIAEGDASTYASAAGQNAQSQTQQELTRLQGINSLNVATTGAAASRFGDTTRAQTAADALAQGAREYNASWAQQQAMRGWNVADQNRAEQFGTRNAILGTVLGDPLLYGDPSGAQGFMNFYNTDFNGTGTGAPDPTLPSGYGTIQAPGP